MNKREARANRKSYNEKAKQKESSEHYLNYAKPNRKSYGGISEPFTQQVLGKVQPLEASANNGISEVKGIEFEGLLFKAFSVR